MADIFISYAREDREWVENLAKALTGEGYTVWWDWDLLVGKRYRETIETELQTCKATVVVWSQHSIRSDFVRDEAEEGQQRNILVPLLKENVRPPAGFRQLQTADLTQWGGATDHVEFRRMMRGLQHVIGGEPSYEKVDPPEAPIVPAATVGPAATIAEPVIQPTPIVAPPPEPVVQAKAPAPNVGSSPPPPSPASTSATPPTSTGVPPRAAAAPSPFAAMKVPPASHPVWRYLAIGAVVLVALIYVVSAFVGPSPEPTPKPTASTHSTPGSGTPANNSDTSNEGQHGSTGGTTAPAPANNTPTLGIKATDMSTATAAVAAVLQKAELADRDARTQADAGLAAQKAAAGGSTSDANGMSLGTATLAEGTYGGQVYNSTAQGVGALSYKNGDLYAGQFDEGKVSGRGVVTFADKSSGYGYSGQFAAGTYNGLGVYYFSNGWRLEGTFKNGQLSGIGAKVDPNGKISEQGTYENGTLKS
ncbi:MAG: TIR domain-containing protein [Alphaproteobacteria bacterium]|nr:TIR domain-containing protein [Alphaproteobacteria bacterium]MBL6937753.1 TIR domain-containing protein [Alphaproteobacteria bacterium]MBL7099421.1 TIR domain-containing protein [Alphaproteobacteria bacterium]